MEIKVGVQQEWIQRESMMVNGEFVQKDVLKKRVRIDSSLSKMQFECLD